MSFCHEPVAIPEMDRQTDADGVRHYVTPEGNRYPSITTILSATKDMTALENWKSRVGKREAEKIKNQSGSLGTDFHDGIERYLHNEGNTIKAPDAKMGFLALKPYLDNHVTKVYNTEIAVWSDVLQIAGTCDFFGEIDQVPAVGDFKTARSRRQREWITDYFLQATFYAYALWERTGIVTRRIDILMVSGESQFQHFQESPAEWLDALQDRIVQYRELVNE